MQEAGRTADYEEGVRCPHCAGEADKHAAALERQRQMELARQRGAAHLGDEAARLAKAEFGDQPDVMGVLTFLEGTKRGICRSMGKDEEEEE